MNRDRYAPWATPLDESDIGPALAALGVVAAAGTWSPASAATRTDDANGGDIGDESTAGEIDRPSDASLQKWESLPPTSETRDIDAWLEDSPPDSLSDPPDPLDAVDFDDSLRNARDGPQTKIGDVLGPAAPIVARMSLRSAVDRDDPDEPLAWTDPIDAPWWPPGDTSPAAAWAAAWRAWRDKAPDSRIRLAMTSAAGDATWLTGLFARDLVGVDSAYVVLDGARRPTPWRFPLRFGFFDDDRGRGLLRAGRSNLDGSFWRGELIKPLLVGRERTTCDVLMIATNPREAVVALRDRPARRRIRARVVLGSRALDPWDPEVVADIADLTGALAIGFCDHPDPADWMVEFTRELSDDMPIDLAFAKTAGRRRAIAAVPAALDGLRVSHRAASVASTLRRSEISAGLDATVADDVLGLADDLDTLRAPRFASEESDGVRLLRMERRADSVIGQASEGRYLQARIQKMDDDTALDRFVAGAEHRIDVRVGVADADWLASDAPFPELAGGPNRLTVVFTENDLLERPQVDVIDLPLVGTSTVASFTLATRPDTETVDARVIVLAGNRVVQTAQLPSTVATRDREFEATTDGTAAATSIDVARPELILTPLSGDLHERRTFDGALVVGVDLDGAAVVTAVVDEVAATTRLHYRDAEGAVAKLSRRLQEIVEAPEQFASLDADGSVELLVFLAVHGGLMRDALISEGTQVAEVLASSQYLQVVSAHPDIVLPIELAYEFPAPDPDATLCARAQETLQSSAPDVRCSGPHTASTVCPLGFLGLTRVIERRAYTVVQTTDDSIELRDRPSRDRGAITLGASVFAASDHVDGFIEGSIASVVAALEETGGAHYQVSTWDDWTNTIANERPGLLLLMPHTVFNDTIEQFGLEIGADAQRWLHQIKHGFVPPADTPAIVALLGCKTARAGELTYERFPSQLVRAGAKVIIATLTEVLGRHAAPIAGRFATELYAASIERPVGVGEVMLPLRRHLLADGMLAVLAVCAFGDADWLITQEVA